MTATAAETARAMIRKDICSEFERLGEESLKGLVLGGEYSKRLWCFYTWSWPIYGVHESQG